MEHEFSREEVIAQVNADIAQFNIRKDELTFPRFVRDKGVAKYRDPATGKTWTGHGRTPMWVKNSPHGKEHFKI